MFRCVMAGLGAAVLAGQVAAAGGSSAPAVGPQYVELKPSIVANFGGVGPIRFVKADLAVRVDGGEAMATVEHHAPQLRHQLVMLLSDQKDGALGSMEGKEALRQQALMALREVMEKEVGQPVVEDLLFNSLVVQR